MPRPNAPSVPLAMRPIYDEVVRLTDSICDARLTDEYAVLAREMAAALARKRPSPLKSGRPSTWACGVLYALGGVNFLFDKSQTPYLPAKELCALLGVSTSNASAKSREIERMLRLVPFDTRWYRPSRLEDNPLAWLMEDSHGFIHDARQLPRELQEELHEAGMIPFVPQKAASRE